MTDSLERFLEDLRFEVPAGMAHRAKAAAASDHTRRVAERREIDWRQPWALTLVAGLLALAIVATLLLGARSLHPKVLVPGGPIPKALVPSDPIPPSLAANGWIAYSTGGQAPGSTDFATGSDIYLVRAGVAPKLIAGRDGGKTRNLCPAFSPDGLRLAYGVDATDGRALVVQAVQADSAILATRRFRVPGSGTAICPRWSADGTRIAYLEGRTVVVRGLDGSTLTAGPGDPRIEDFGLAVPILDGARRQWTDPLLSPQGDRTAHLDASTCKLVVARPDGTGPHTIGLSPICAYAVATWSPDGRQVLVMQDVGGHAFALRTIAVDSPFEMVTIVSSDEANGERSRPGWGDVSWQPVLP